MQLSLDTPVRFVPHIGPVMAVRLAKLDIFTAQDLLYHVPFRYNDFSLVSPIARLQPGETATVRGTVSAMRNVFTKTGKRFQQAVVGDDTGHIEVVWFNQPYLTKVIKVGDILGLAGTVGWFGTKIVLTSPEYEILGQDSGQSLHMGRLVPVYPETEGVSSKWLRGRIAYTLNAIGRMLGEFLPADILERYHLMDRRSALQAVHFPQTLEQANESRHRLSFDELFLLQLRGFREKHEWESTQIAPAINLPPQHLDSFLKRLPFELTGDQHAVTAEILSDLARTIPMNRILEGDVGSGKTVVAAIAMYAVFQNGRRAILLAPTQILAEQHFETIQTILSLHGLSVALVTANKKPETLNVDVLVGTHALLSQSVSFDNVGLIVIDEQQRFGVKQRALIREKGKGKFTPHLLTMTATPIPRTIALTIYGNLSLSILHQMPKGRKPIKTWVVPTQKRDGAYEWIAKQIREKHIQAFVVCPLIDQSESLVSIKAAKAEYKHLRTDVFPSLSLGLLHGKLKPKEKTATLQQFRVGKIDILVTTPVVEVGIDIANASIMLIEAADRFGLSQLHQLRGRVGRGDKESYCLLFTQTDTTHVLDRLKALEKIHNGPQLAELDLTLRGPGELFGTRQHGALLLKIADLTDTTLISDAQKAAASLAQKDPTLVQFPLLSQELSHDTIQSASID